MKNLNKRPRITSGKLKGKKLNVPNSARPVTDRVKKSIFDTLGDLLEGSVCLDVFAGTGALGIEAFSRGASKVDFIEMDKDAFRTLIDNIKTVGINREQADLYNISYTSFLKRYRNKKIYDFIFIDPPFHKTLDLQLRPFKTVSSENTIIILKIKNVRLEEDFLGGFEIIHEKSFGANKCLYLKAIKTKQEDNI